MTTRATFRHAWRALYRNLTLVDVKGVPFSLDRVVYETLVALSDVARRLAKAHVTAYCRWDGEEDSRPKLHKAASLFITVSTSCRPTPTPRLRSSQASPPRCKSQRAGGLPGPHLKGRARPAPTRGVGFARTPT